LLDLILAAQAVPSPRIAGPILVFAAAAFWRPASAGEDALHPGAFDAHILDALSDGVAVLTDGGRIRAVNASLEALAQMPRQRLMNLELGELLGDPPEDASRRARHETVLASEGGEAIPVSVSTSPLRDRQGSLIGCAVAIRDRREIVDLQRHLVTSARFAAVGELAAGLAHEVNNPLAFIQANLNQMQRDYAEFKSRLESASAGGDSVLREGEQLIADCLEGIGRVASIVREVRGFAHGGDDLDRLCDVNALLELAMRMACPPHRNAARVVRRYEEVPAVHCSEQDLKQLFLGLVMHATQPSRKASYIRLVTEARGSAVRVTIEDDGLGYSEQDMDRVFEPSLDDSGVAANGGMGLSIAYHIAHQLGGEVEVESDPAGETRVGVVLPCGGEFDPLESGARSRSQTSSRTH